MKSVFIWALLAPSLRELPRCACLGKEGRGEGERAAPSGSLEDAGVTPSARLIGHCAQSQQSQKECGLPFTSWRPAAATNNWKILEKSFNLSVQFSPDA